MRKKLRVALTRFVVGVCCFGVLISDSIIKIGRRVYYFTIWIYLGGAVLVFGSRDHKNYNIPIYPTPIHTPRPDKLISLTWHVQVLSRVLVSTLLRGVLLDDLHIWDGFPRGRGTRRWQSGSHSFAQKVLSTFHSKPCFLLHVPVVKCGYGSKNWSNGRRNCWSPLALKPGGLGRGCGDFNFKPNLTI